MKKGNQKSQIVIYKAESGQVKIDVRFENETVWLTQKQMAELFDCSVDNVGLHLKNIYLEGELAENLTTEESSVVQIEGGRQINRRINLYNLDAIISVGYRVNSLRGTQFRIWATERLKEKKWPKPSPARLWRDLPSLKLRQGRNSAAKVIIN